ncbi:MAG: glycosyltransferase [Candidatus Omnitrophica bacterium]|nr:glycosyltransferase [Candidatus Omnitrophota bacterium]
MKEKLKQIGWIYDANAYLRAKIQDRKAESELNYYRARAARENIVCLENEKLIEEFQKRLKNRGVTPSFKEKGELHIFLAYYVSNWEAILPKTLRSFGRVTEFEWGCQGFDIHSFGQKSYRDKMNNAMLNAFYEAHKQQPIDIVVGYLAGKNTSPEVLQKMGENRAIIFNFCFDDKLSLRGKMLNGQWTGPAALASSVDLNLTNAPETRIKYLVEGGLSMFWPEAADPGTHKPYDVPFKFDVSFVGQKYGWRLKFIAKLERTGINVTCFGNGWENGPLSDEEMIKLYSRSRINLGFAGVGHSKKLMCLKGRDFEVPMSGGLYLTQDNQELSLVYDVGKEIVTYKDENDCAKKIKWLLSNSDETDKIRKAGRNRAVTEHTWGKRFHHIFSLAGLLEDSTPEDI